MNTSTDGAGAPEGRSVSPSAAPAANGGRSGPPSHAVGSIAIAIVGPVAPFEIESTTPSTIGHEPRGVPPSPTNGLIASNRSVTLSSWPAGPPANTWALNHPPGSVIRPTGATIERSPSASGAVSRPSASARASTVVRTVASRPRIPVKMSRIASAGAAAAAKLATPSMSGFGHSGTTTAWPVADARSSDAVNGANPNRMPAALKLASPIRTLPVGAGPPRSCSSSCHASAPSLPIADTAARRDARSIVRVAGSLVIATTSPARVASGTSAAIASKIADRPGTAASCGAMNATGSWSRCDSESGTRPVAVLRPIPSSRATRCAAPDVASASRRRFTSAATTARASGRNGKSSIVPVTVEGGRTTMRSR